MGEHMKFGVYRIDMLRIIKRVCANAETHQSRRFSYTQSDVSDEGSDLELLANLSAFPCVFFSSSDYLLMCQSQQKSSALLVC